MRRFQVQYVADGPASSSCIANLRTRVWPHAAHGQLIGRYTVYEDLQKHTVAQKRCLPRKCGSLILVGSNIERRFPPSHR
jgi:hypothetical protein